MHQRGRQLTIRVLAVILCVFTLAEVNYPLLRPLSQVAIFAWLGVVICYLSMPAVKRWRDTRLSRALDWVLALATTLCCGYVVVQSEPTFRSAWSNGRSLGDRAGAETALDVAVGVVGLLLMIEAARRAVGWALPVLALLFIAYASFGQAMPSWLFPHRGYDLPRIVSQTFLHSQGVFGVALSVMFAYVFLFVVFGALLESTGAIRFIIDYARRLLSGTAGGPAKVAILSSGVMGSLSGSAVANAATIGTFTIPLMRSAGFKRHVAAGIEAAASSGGALVPPVMGAGAYMMLEIVEPPVTYLQIVQAAVLPAVLYYLSLFLNAHFSARKLAEEPTAGASAASAPAAGAPLSSELAEGQGGGGKVEGAIFFGSLVTLVALLLLGFTVFRAVSLAMAATFLLSLPSARTRLTWRRILSSLESAARAGVPLVAASATVGVVIGVVTLTGIGTALPSTILPLAQDNLLLALLLIMLSSLVLGMGLPSAVCYLLLATLIGPALGGLGVVPLAAHFFIFYFGLMSMVTPPVALAAYTTASIAGSGIMETSVAAFRFSLIGFALPFLFVYRPQLLMLAPDGGPASLFDVALAFTVACAAILPLAAALAGHLSGPLTGTAGGRLLRAGLALSALGLLYPAGDQEFLPELPISLPNVLGAALLVVVLVLERRRTRRLSSPPES